jgi:hypothetical protein
MSDLLAILSFRGRLQPRPYAMASFGVLLTQHLLIALACHGLSPDAQLWSQFSMYPFVFSAPPGPSAGLADLITFADVILTFAAAWLLGALALARVTDRGGGAWIGAAAVLPLLQVPAILYLALARPPKASAQVESQLGFPWSSAAQGVAVATALSLFAVAVGALGFGSYGWSMFCGAPLLIGIVSAYLANRTRDIGFSRTVEVVAVANALGAIGLLSFALEGIVCLAMAAPFALALGWVGGLIGRWLAGALHRPVRDTLASFVVLPLAFAIENAIPDTTRFATAESIDVRAPPMAVWRAVTHMGRINAEPSLLFRMGFSYPTEGVIHGEGVGAIREGHFSTGVAYERVVDWEPGRRLTFDVLSDAPSLRELSPYQDVHAPHVEGYFRTRVAEFDITPIPGGSRLTLKTTHELDLNPAFYWAPIARWVTHQNEVRVLTHFRGLAEAIAAQR